MAIKEKETISEIKFFKANEIFKINFKETKLTNQIRAYI